jgi:tetratricopeptide (TPR) repeat protein
MHRILRPPLAAFSLLFAVLGVALGPSPAWAQGPSTPADSQPNEEALAEAARRYDLGLKLYAEGEFRLAVIEFERTYQITNDYRVLYNIGQVRIQLGNYAKAIGFLNEYLKLGGDKISEDRKKAVEADLEMLASRTGKVKIAANVAGADILVDDLVVGQSPMTDEVLLDAGEHKITARKAGYDARAQQLTLAGADSTQISIKLEKLPEGGQKVIVVKQESDPTWMIAAWTATGVLAVGAGVTGGLGIKAANDLEDMRKDPDATPDERESQADRAKTLLLSADVMGAAAIVTGGIALYLTLSAPDSDSKEGPPKAKPAGVKTGLVIGPNRIALRGEF